MNWNWYLIPIQGSIPQTFQIPLAGGNYVLTFKWNNMLEGGWVMDLGDADTGDVLCGSIPLICGCNLLAGLEYLGIGGLFVVQTNGLPDAVPTFTNLGIDSNLYFLTAA
jgi:hypothetical protein